MQEEEGATVQHTKRWGQEGKRPDIRDYIRIHKIWNRLVKYYGTPFCTSELVK